MGTTTTNFNLVKPDLTDPINITELNDNFDTIDARLKDAMDAAESLITSNLLRFAITTTTQWSGTDPYTQTITINNAPITARSKIDLQPDATVINQLIADGVKGMYVGNNNGTLTLYAIGAAPTAAMTIQCTVEDTSVALTGLTITTNPTKTTYAVGSVLDLTGMVVTATFSDGSTANVTSSCTSIPEAGRALTTTGTQTVTISYAHEGVTKTATFDISVVAAVTGIAVTTIPTTTQYEAGDTLDLTGIVVTATYSDEDTDDVTSSCVFVPAEGTTLSEVGTQEVSVSYTENGITRTTSFDVEVSEAA